LRQILRVGQPPIIRMDYKDYRQLPDDGMRYELLEGDLEMASAPAYGHQWVVYRLWRILDDLVREGLLGEAMGAPLDVVLAERTVVQPDLVAVVKERTGIFGPKGITGRPDLIVEVVSAGRGSYDRSRKRLLYERYAVPHYWVIEPKKREVEEYVRSRGKLRLRRVWKEKEAMRPAVVPGASIVLASIWPPLKAL